MQPFGFAGLDLSLRSQGSSFFFDKKVVECSGASLPLSLTSIYATYAFGALAGPC